MTKYATGEANKKQAEAGNNENNRGGHKDSLPSTHEVETHTLADIGAKTYTKEERE